MRKTKAIFAIAIALGVAIAAAAHAQTSGKVTPLTALDYAEIQQLYARYAFAYDTAEDNGYAYARLFTPDGAFTFPNGDPRKRCNPTCQGPEALAQLARGTGNKGPLTLSHVTTNIVIDATPEGANGKAYLTLVGIGAGVYADKLVKTSDGWRFRLRSYTPLPNPQRTQAPSQTR